MIDSWYYDACALDSGTEVYGEMTSKSNPIRPIVSHLALGEAYGNCHNKGKAQEDAFLRLMRVASRKMEIVGNDGIEEILSITKETFPKLSFTDAIHLATAIKFKCNIFRTSDNDFCGLDHEKVKKYGSNFEIPNFRIKKVG